MSADSAFSEGFFQLLIGKHEKAEPYFTIAIQKQYKLANAYLYRAKCRMSMKRNAEALEDLNASIKQDSTEAEAYIVRGVIYRRLKKYQISLMDFDKAESLSPNSENLAYSRGLTEFDMELYTKAIKSFDKAIALKPEHGQAYKYRGLSYLMINDKINACNDFHMAKKNEVRGLDDFIDSTCKEVAIDPGFQPNEYDWNFYKDPVYIDSANAQQFKTYSFDKPESLLNYFFASKIRKDEDWKNVFLPDAFWSERIKSKMNTYDVWKFIKYHIVAKQKAYGNTWYFRIYFEIEYQGKREGGEDEAELIFKNGKWLIISVPT